MSIKGRGTLEVKPSRNPFLQTTSSDIGVNTKDRIDWNYDLNPSLVKPSSHALSENFAFLYSRESDRIGAKVKKPDFDRSIPSMMTRTEFLKKRREELLASKDVTELLNNDSAVTKYVKPNAEEILKHYKHEPKYEDPRYTVTSVSFIHLIIFDF